MEESEEMKKMKMKVEIPNSSQLTRQTSATKTTCLCAPTSHAGSFRCRLHRLQPTKSFDSENNVKEVTTIDHGDKFSGV
ncbi:serine-rich protein-related [Euphorbia peplus]|nr:serine-rich protein-related [Euphorbia peplus]